jgi:surface-anchored protein
LASEELTPGDWDTAITFTLGSVTSPSGNGTFSMWANDGLGIPTFHFSSTNPGETNDNNNFLSNFSHDHVNWGFTEPGEWLVELTASGTPAGAGSPVSATETLSFSVIPEPSTSLLAGLSVLGLVVRRKRK